MKEWRMTMKVVLQNLTKKFPNRNRKVKEDVVAVDNFTFEIPDGKLVGLLGPSGCGKSTTLNLLCGLQKPTSGKIFFGEDDVTNLPAEHRGVGMVFQNYALYPHMTVYRNMAFGMELRKEDKKVIDKKVREVAKSLEIEYLLNRKPKELSGGQRQRVAVGRAMVRNPSVFLFDEPLSNLDAKLRGEMRTVITKLYQELQTTFVYVTHDQIEAMTMADRIVVMKDGYIQQIDTPQNLYDYPCNMFVAGFLGMPEMNFFEGELDKDSEDYYIKFKEYRILIPTWKNKDGKLESYVGKSVIAGIRPSDMQISESQTKECSIAGTVELRELMGAEFYLYVKSEGIRFTVRTTDNVNNEIGSNINLNLDIEKIHLFDKETTSTITN